VGNPEGLYSDELYGTDPIRELWRSLEAKSEPIDVIPATEPAESKAEAE
jgi:hypothetical protein